MTYFKRYRMEIDLRGSLFSPPALPPGYQLLEWHDGLIEAHAEVKYQCFCSEVDANVFPCLGEREGCLRLMREIARREGFLPEATWLLAASGGGSDVDYCGTVQGVQDADDCAAIQNLGVKAAHRGLGLGTVLMHRALLGFRQAGLPKAYLEVTAQNSGAVRLYHRLGFRHTKTTYKAADVACA